MSIYIYIYVCLYIYIYIIYIYICVCINKLYKKVYMSIYMRNKVFKTNDIFDTNFHFLQAFVK